MRIQKQPKILSVVPWASQKELNVINTDPVNTTDGNIVFHEKYFTPDKFNEDYTLMGDNKYYSRGFVYRMTCPIDIVLVDLKKRKRN